MNIIEFENLECKVRKKRLCRSSTTRTVFDNVSGAIPRGKFTACIGPSGAGKTTLIDTLAGRLGSHVAVSGSVRYMSATGEATKRLLKSQTAYVKQNDVFMPTATVYESLLTSAMLRLPRDMSFKQKRSRVNAIIQQLGLESCRGTKMGDQNIRGVSGGEKKRAAIGVELITDPAIMFMDEPTSGLDAATSLSIVHTLLRLTKADGRTVVATLHQPRSNIFYLFDNIIVLAPGGIVYNGPARDAVAYFAGLQPPIRSPTPHFNPADFLLDILCDNDGFISADQYTPLIGCFERHKAAGDIHEVVARGNEVDSATPGRDASTVVVAPTDLASGKGLNRGWLKRLKAPTSAVPVMSMGGVELVVVKAKDEPDPKDPSPDGADAVGGGDGGSGAGAGAMVDAAKQGKKAARFHTQFAVLFVRATLNAWRNPMIIFSEVVQYIIFALLTGLMYQGAKTNQSGLRDRQAALFFAVVNLAFIPGFTVIAVFPTERALFNRERATGAYGALAFFLAYVMNDAPRQHFFGVAFSAIVYYLIGFNDEFNRFLIFTATLSILLHTASAFSLCVSALVPKADVGTLVLSFSLVIWMSFGGFFIVDSNTPYIFYPFLYTSWIRYAFRALCVNEFSGQTGYTCDTGEICAYTNGQDVLKALSYEDAVVWVDITILFGILVFFRLTAYLALRFLKMGDN